MKQTKNQIKTKLSIIKSTKKIHKIFQLFFFLSIKNLYTNNNDAFLQPVTHMKTLFNTNTHISNSHVDSKEKKKLQSVVSVDLVIV